MTNKKHIYIPTQSPDDWRNQLADPAKHWRPNYSAWELASCWEAANGFPASLRAMFASAENPALRKLDFLQVFPEHKVGLPGGGHASQNDLFALARAADGNLVSITVEGKVAEPFGKTLEAWLAGASDGKQVRLKFLCESLV